MDPPPRETPCHHLALTNRPDLNGTFSGWARRVVCQAAAVVLLFGCQRPWVEGVTSADCCGGGVYRHSKSGAGGTLGGGSTFTIKPINRLQFLLWNPPPPPPRHLGRPIQANRYQSFKLTGSWEFTVSGYQVNERRGGALSLPSTYHNWRRVHIMLRTGQHDFIHVQVTVPTKASRCRLCVWSLCCHQVKPVTRHSAHF